MSPGPRTFIIFMADLIDTLVFVCSETISLQGVFKSRNLVIAVDEVSEKVKTSQQVLLWDRDRNRNREKSFTHGLQDSIGAADLVDTQHACMPS